MSYYIAKTVSGPFEAVVADVTAQLKKQGFGVLTDIDVQATLKAKLGADTAEVPDSRGLQSAICPRGTEDRGETWSVCCPAM